MSELTRRINNDATRCLGVAFNNDAERCLGAAFNNNAAKCLGAANHPRHRPSCKPLDPKDKAAMTI